ncbi:MAG: hypothetical protein ABR583_05360 [Gaiellaceae bacterium]
MLEPLVIDPFFNGPPGSANGGYTCGLLAARLGGEAEVTLRRPPPLGRPLRVEWRGEGLAVLDGDEVVAEAVPARVEVRPPVPPYRAEADEASRRYPGFRHHAYPTCVVCGPERADGLRIFAAPLPGTEIVAAPWTPAAEPPPEIVWAALDCPGAIAVGFPERGEWLLGRLAARVVRLPRAGEPCIVVGWPLGGKGRRAEAGTALHGAAGEVLALARATWVQPRA